MSPGNDDNAPVSFSLDVGDDEPVDDGSTAPIQAPGGRRHKDRSGSTPQEKGVRHLLSAITDKTPRPRAKRLVVETFGKGPRGGPNVGEAARELGVHPSTVRRWIKSGKIPPRSSAGAKLRDQWQSSPAGRRASISPARRRALREAPPTSAFAGALTGHVWVDTFDTRNGDQRSFNFTLSAEKTREMHQALIDGEDERALEILEGNLDGFGSQVQIDLTDFTWKNL